jgi:hypothetical protein
MRLSAPYGDGENPAPCTLNCTDCAVEGGDFTLTSENGSDDDGIGGIQLVERARLFRSAQQPANLTEQSGLSSILPFASL